MIGLKGVWEVPQPVVSVLDPFCSVSVEVVSCLVQSTEVLQGGCLLCDVDPVAALVDPVAALVDLVAALVDPMKTWKSPTRASEHPRESSEREHASLQ